jgi:hypothetical protein
MGCRHTLVDSSARDPHEHQPSSASSTKYIQGRIFTNLFLNLFTGKLALANRDGFAFTLANF